MGTFVRIAFAVTALCGTVAADPAPRPGSGPAPAPPTAPPAAPPLTRQPSATPYLVLDLPPRPVPSLRLEAVRVAGERFDGDWRYPEPGPLFGYNEGTWFVAYGHYRPRTGRSAALHGGSMAATMVGEILLSADSPVAGVGALLTGATLDAAGADVDRDAEARKR